MVPAIILGPVLNQVSGVYHNVVMASVKFLPDPGRMLITPLGKPAFAASSANFNAVIDVT